MYEFKKIVIVPQARTCRNDAEGEFRGSKNPNAEIAEIAEECGVFNVSFSACPPLSVEISDMRLCGDPGPPRP